jgi:hypothetical protein
MRVGVIDMTNEQIFQLAITLINKPDFDIKNIADFIDRFPILVNVIGNEMDNHHAENLAGVE